jgi:biotin-(acetyl-CoA carboxylase) ligase
LAELILELVEFVFFPPAAQPMSITAARLPLPDLPPSYRLVVLRERDDAFRHACKRAAEAGAGTLVWVRRFDLLEFAVVLAPDEPLAPARRAFFAGMSALADAVGSACPPDKPVEFEWPDTVVFDQARLGGGRLGWPEQCPEDEVPDWLVFSAMLLASKRGAGEPGLTRQSTSLEDEGCDFTHEAFLESFARNLMRAFHIWNEQGFQPLAADYLARLIRPAGKAARTSIAENGDLVLDGAGAAGRLALRPALKAPAWLDPATGRPRL